MLKKSKRVCQALMATLILSSGSQVNANNSTWTGNTDNDLTNPTNWTNNVPTEIATFPIATREAPFLDNGTFSLNEFLFPSTNGATYSFNISSATSAALEFVQNGIVNNSGFQQEFTIDNNGLISFINSASTDSTAS